MRSNSKLAKWFMLGVIPVIFTVVLCVALLMFLGVDRVTKIAKVGQNLPLVGKYFSAEDQSEEAEQRKIEQLVAELEQKQETIDQLRQELQTEKEKTEELEAQNREKAEKERAEAEEQTVNSYKQVAQNLEGMFASKSAPIVTYMPPEEGLLILYLMDADAQSQLLAKVSPDQAAVYTLLLKELAQQSHSMPLVQASTEVVAQYEDVFAEWDRDRNPEDWAVMFANMPPSNAADILDAMDETRAINILRELDNSTKAAILSSLDTQKASQFSRLLVDGS